MVHAFSAALGVALCGLGLSGLALGPSLADAGQLRNEAVHDVLCLLTGLIVLMGIVERSSVARRLCMAAAAAHAAVVVLALIEAPSATPLVTFRTIDLCVSSLVVVSCLTMSRARASRRRRLAVYGKFHAQLIATKPEGADG